MRGKEVFRWELSWFKKVQRREESLLKTGNSKQIDEGDVGSDAQAAKEGSSFKGAGWTVALRTSWREIRGSVKNAHVYQFAYTEISALLRAEGMEQ